MKPRRQGVVGMWWSAADVGGYHRWWSGSIDPIHPSGQVFEDSESGRSPADR